jgi:hypothetical protein
VPPASSPAAERGAVPQDSDRNVLLAATGGAAFADRARELGVAVGGWTGSGKFADLDNDGWPDLYVVNGDVSENRRESDVFYRNREGRHFDDVTAEAGLESHLATGAAVIVDLDRDGALDVVNVPFEGSVQVFRNRGAVGNAVAFELRDELGNSHGIGSRITGFYGKGESLHQMREIKAGGGFLAFDPPGAHFGLGEYEQFDRLEVLWSTGERTKIFGPFEMGYRYRIHRDLLDLPRLALPDFFD